MGSNPTTDGRSKSISTTKPPSLIWYVVLFRFTYNCPFVNNVYSVTLSYSCEPKICLHTNFFYQIWILSY
jgi:hypothetical protein